MSKTDLILLHAPSIYDFRKKHQMFGPISDVVPSSVIFEMYPIGFMIMLGYLEERGVSVRIINLALRMLKSKKFDVEKLLRSLNPVVFGIDLHWLPHVQGSLEIARLVKKYHPETPVIFGGLSSSYFHEELITYSPVDYVLRGDTVEKPLFQLIQHIKQKREPRGVPNLTWRDNRGEITVNQLTHSPETLDYYPFDYRKILRSIVKHFDIIGHLPFYTWMRYPIVVMLPWKGCVHDCIICGGSAHFYEKYCGRAKPAYRSPEHIVRDIVQVAKFLKGPIFLLGELRQAGEGYAEELFARIKKAKIKNHIAIELFYPASRKYFEMIADAVTNFNFEISPESHDEKVRKTFGRHYDNQSLEDSIQYAMELGCKRFDLFFMIGLAGQTAQSVQGTVDYCDYLIRRFSQFGIGNVVPFISPLAPFIDPGSLAFENPEKYGFRQFCRTLEDHRKAMLSPSWKYMLSYETKWMTRDEIVESTYDAAIRLNRIKAEHGIIKPDEATHLEGLISEARREMRNIDMQLAGELPGDDKATPRDMRTNAVKLSEATICKKDELNWPFKFLRFNPIDILKAVFQK